MLSDIKRMFTHVSWLFLFCCLLFSNATIEAQAALEKRFLEIDGLQRFYYLYLPEHLVEEAPLVFALHGYGGSAEKMIDFSKMNEVADKNGFAVCYPQGYLGPDNKNSWNAGYSNPDVDDVHFLTTLAQYLQKEFHLSSQNTFSTGMSNGADMCYVLACRQPDVFAAIAPVAGCMMKATFEACTSERGVPIFEIHGTKDSITLWDGDVDYLPGSGGYLGTSEIIEFWKKKNGCSQTKIDTLPDLDTSDGSFVTSQKYSGPDPDNTVWLYTLVNGQHDWPGSWGNMDFQASKEIWSFFSNFIKDPQVNGTAKDRSHLVFFGSSVCKGSGAKNDAGYAWQFYHSGGIDTTRYAYFNASTGGDNTLKVEQENRLPQKLYPTDPDIVVIGLSLANEGIRSPHTDEGRATVLEQFRSRLGELADSLSKQDINVIIANCYPHSYFYESQYTSIKNMNRLINTWKYPSINLLGTINDGQGRWVEGFARDPGHPNTDGHYEMSLAIVPTLFDAIRQGKRTPVYDWNKSYTHFENQQQQEMIAFDVTDTMHSFTMSFRFKNAASGVLARIYTDQGIRELNVEDFSLAYSSISTTFPKHTGNWNQVVLSHNYADQSTLIALNGVVIGAIKERLIPQRIVYGGTLESVDLKDLSLHRSSLHESEIADLNNQLFIQSSLEVYCPLTQPMEQGRLPNRAQSLTYFRSNPDVEMQWVEKKYY